MEVGDDIHRAIRERYDSILLEQRVSNLFYGIEVELIGRVSTHGISVWRVFGRLVDLIDRGPSGVGASEDLVKILCRNLYIFSEIYWKFVSKAVDDKIKLVPSSIRLYACGCFTLYPSGHFF